MRTLKKIKLLTTLAVSFLLLGHIESQAQLALVEELDIEAIKSMNVHQKGKQVRVKVTILVSNNSDKQVKMRNGVFNVGLGGNRQTVHVGKGEIKDLVIPAKSNGRAGRAETTMDIMFGYESVDTTKRMFMLFNIIANPALPKTMTLSGESDIGIHTRRGWAYQKSIEIDSWRFQPRIQSQVLFN